MNRHRFAGLSAAVLIVLILFSCRERVKVGSRVSYKSPDLLEFLKTESDLTVLPLLTGFPDSLQGISSAERLESDIKVNFRDLKIKKYSVLYNRLNGESEAGALLSLMSDFLETGEIQGGPDSSLASYFESRYVLFSREIKRESVKNFDGVTNERYVVECMIYDLKYRKKIWAALVSAYSSSIDDTTIRDGYYADLVYSEIGKALPRDPRRHLMLEKEKEW